MIKDYNIRDYKYNYEPEESDFKYIIGKIWYFVKAVLVGAVIYASLILLLSL